jgi:hypothetical protein
MDINLDKIIYFDNMFVFNNSHKILSFMYDNYMIPLVNTD